MAMRTPTTAGPRRSSCCCPERYFYRGRSLSSTTWVREPVPGSANSRSSGRWGSLSSFYSALCVCLALGLAAWPRVTSSRHQHATRPVADKLGTVFCGGCSVAAVMVIPIWFLQYTAWGVAISGPYLRVLIWCLASALDRVPCRAERTAAGGLGLVSCLALLLTGAAFAVAAAFTGVTTYPFSLGWSEGNRLWDYSLLFGKRLYSYPPSQVPAAYLDIGRQLAGGLPFLLPRVSILGERLWLAALGVLPYLLLGVLVFWADATRPHRGIDSGRRLGFLFLSQGPIHSPLLFCAILVAMAWRLPTLPAAVLVAISGYFAEVSRFTWMFAPALWAAMLEIAASTPVDSRIPRAAWRRAGLLGSAGRSRRGPGNHRRTCQKRGKSGEYDRGFDEPSIAVVSIIPKCDLRRRHLAWAGAGRGASAGLACNPSGEVVEVEHVAATGNRSACGRISGGRFDREHQDRWWRRPSQSGHVSHRLDLRGGPGVEGRAGLSTSLKLRTLHCGPERSWYCWWRCQHFRH